VVTLDSDAAFLRIVAGIFSWTIDVVGEAALNGVGLRVLSASARGLRIHFNASDDEAFYLFVLIVVTDFDLYLRLGVGGRIFSLDTE
jgi:hypothetical protein